MARKVNLGTFNIGQSLVNPTTGAGTTAFIRYINDVVGELQSAVNANADNNQAIQNALASIGVVVNTAQTIQQQTTLLQLQANSAATAAKITNSYVSPSAILTAATAMNATTSSITIADHTRIYGDGTTVSVKGATIANLTPATAYYIVYTDASFSGGTVSYRSVTSAVQAGQMGSQLLVGLITTPASSTTAAGAASADGIYPPGVMRARS